MMIKVRRLMALLLSLTLVCCLMPAAAEGTDEPTDEIVIVDDPSEATEAPTTEPTATPTTEPTATPTAEPTATPTTEPTATPTAEPTATPTSEPTATPTAEPTATPTAEPTATPTTEPTTTPTAEPEQTQAPSEEATQSPVISDPPSVSPAVEPDLPTSKPTESLEKPTVFQPGLAQLSADTKLYDNQRLQGEYAQLQNSGVVYAAAISKDETSIQVTLYTGEALWTGWVKASRVKMLTDEVIAKYEAAAQQQPEELRTDFHGYTLLKVSIVFSSATEAPTATPTPEVDERPVITLAPEEPTPTPVPQVSTDHPAEPTATVEPVGSPSPSTEPTQTVEPVDSPSPSSEPTQTVEPVDSPSPSTEPTQTVEPVDSPSPSTEPTQTVEPVDSPSPSTEPTQTVEPVDSPSPSTEPTQTVEPVDSPSPSTEPTQTVEPIDSPSPETTPTVSPDEPEEPSEVIVDVPPEMTVPPTEGAEDLVEPTVDESDVLLPENTELDELMLYRSLDVPSGLNGSHHGSYTTLRWTGVENATDYAVLYKEAWSSEYRELGQTQDTSYTTGQLDPGTVYYFRVQALQRAQDGTVVSRSAQSASYPYIQLGNAKLQDPRGRDTSTVYLTWNEVPGANEYDIEMSIHGAGRYSTVLRGVKENECDITGLSFNETYDFRVTPKRRLYSGQVLTGYPSQVAMVGSPMETPSFTEYVWEENGLRLHWNAIPGANGYVIYRRGFHESSYSKLVVLNKPETTYVDTTLERGEVYYYFVYSFRTTVEGWACFSLKGNIGMGVWLDIPTNLTFTSLDTQGTRIDWPVVTNANGYDVFISTRSGQTPKVSGHMRWNYGYHTSAVLDRTYYYRVRTVRTFSNGDVSYSPWSEEFSYARQAVQPTYRALLIGNTYENQEDYLPGCDNDAQAMASMLRRMSGTPYSINVQHDLSDSGMIAAIQSTFAGAKASDVSLFYFSGHGANSPDTDFHGALVGRLHTYLSVSRLKEELDKVPGRKIVILDSCHSGFMIGKDGEPTVNTSPSTFNSEVIRLFSSSPAMSLAALDEEMEEVVTDDASAMLIPRSGGNLASSGYYVITAAHSSEQSVSASYDQNHDNIGDRFFGLFTYSLCYGSGWNSATNQGISELKADRDSNGKITLYEAYLYAKVLAKQKNPNQNAQIYPDNSAFVVWSK